MKELEFEKVRAHGIQNVIANYESEFKVFQHNADSVAKSLALDESVMRLDAGRRLESKDYDQLISRWIGVSPTDWDRTNGFVAISLRNVPMKTGKLPIIIDGKDTGKFYSDRLDPAELVKRLRKNRNFDALSELTKGMPTEKQLYDEKIGIYAIQKKYDDAITPIRELNRLNNDLLKLSRGGITGALQAQFEKVWQSDPDRASAAGYQKTLIGAIREAVVGPGNPSNYEQEVLNSIIPDVNEFLSRPERVKGRMRALATITMLSHYNNMVANGLEPTDLSMKMYSKQLGSVLGYEVTPEIFNRLYTDFDKQRTIYTTNEGIKSENKDLAKEYANRLIDSLEQQAK